LIQATAAVKTLALLERLPFQESWRAQIVMALANDVSSRKILDNNPALQAASIVVSRAG
jgi:hypothetical protein